MGRSAKPVLLTDKYIQGLSVGQGGRLKVADQRAEGLRLRIGGSRKVFSYEGRGLDGRIRTITIGPYPDVSLREARAEAEVLRRRLRRGEDPTAEKAAARAPRLPEITVRELLVEYQAYAAPTRSIWRPSKRSKKSEARSRIEAVFHVLLDKPVPSLTSADLAASMRDYKPRSKGKATSNGQVSRARAYVAPVLDWAANRKSFKKYGAGRSIVINAPCVSETHDSASTDPSIKGTRDRVLVQDELAALLPLLRPPASINAKEGDDLRPAAMRFILLTAARLGEVTSMRWRHLNQKTGLWHKPSIKSTRGGPREQHLPLPDAAWELLKALPSWKSGGPDDLVFPNGEGGELGNWSREGRATQLLSGVKGWHRHDLRRTASTLLDVLGTPTHVIRQILGHKTKFTGGDVSPSLGNYVIIQKVLRDVEDPQKAALDKLAGLLAMIETEGLARRDQVTAAPPGDGSSQREVALTTQDGRPACPDQTHRHNCRSGPTTHEPTPKKEENLR